MLRITDGVICIFFVYCHASHIMIYAPMTSKSETLFMYPYAEALAARGHQVTVVCPFVSSEPLKNVRLIAPQEFQDVLKMEDEVGDALLGERVSTPYNEAGTVTCLNDLVVELTKTILIKRPEILEMVDKKVKIDLMIINGALNIGGLALTSIFQCPFAYLDGSGYYPYHNSPTGNLDMPATSPTTLSGFVPPLSFTERIQNAYYYFLWKWKYESFVNEIEDILRPVYEKRGMKYPLLEVEKNVSLVLSYRDASLEFPRPFYPNVVRIGCVHCREPKPLPKDIEEFVSTSGKHGFIVFSMGSLCRTDNNREYFRKNFFKAFAKIPQKVLMKWDSNVTNEEIGAPPNVKIVEWLPQQDLIAHPKCHAFISHSGLLSTMEAAYHGVPVISVPIFWDQDYNSNILQKLGMGIKLEAGEITADSLLDSLQKITTNPSYHENAIRRSKILRDQPMKPVDWMVYWTEYLLRHKGADHLRPIDAMNMPWYQIWMVDAVALAIAILIGVLIVLRKVVHLLFSTKDVQKLQNKKKK